MDWKFKLKEFYWSLFEKAKQIKPISSSSDYWNHRYENEGNSGAGSYGKFAEFKAKVINEFVIEKTVGSVIEFGCGDGNQLSLMKYPLYMGVDVSDKAIAICTEKFSEQSNYSFRTLDSYGGEQAELILSLDVIYHLLEDDVYEGYMNSLFNASDCYVIIYSSNSDDNVDYKNSHVKHRVFTKWVETNKLDWNLVNKIPNIYPKKDNDVDGSFADFYFYMKRT